MVSFSYGPQSQHPPTPQLKSEHNSSEEPSARTISINISPAVKSDNKASKATAGNTCNSWQMGKGDSYKSTQATNKHTECVDIGDPGLSCEFKMEMLTPPDYGDRESCAPAASLSSRKKTIMSVNADSESERSIALLDFEPLPFARHANLMHPAHLLGSNTRVYY
jgi:hypothetical protein